MPAHAAEIGQELIDQLKHMLDGAFERVVGQPGDPYQLENDALSVVANVGAFVAMQLTARLIMLKGVDLTTAVYVAQQDIIARQQQHIATMLETRAT